MKKDLLEVNEPQVPYEEEASEPDVDWTVLESERTKNAPLSIKWLSEKQLELLERSAS